ncbi:MAG: hypothetical protein AB7S50_13590 [Bacteroidales bacterium]
MNDNNIYEKLKDLLDKAGGKYTILEDQVDVDLQMKFFEYSNELRKNKCTDEDVLLDSTLLYDLSVEVEVKKRILSELSESESVEGFRELEKFLKVADKDLRPWAVLSFQHCRIGLESKLLDEHKVFISTGLGGKDDKLRYFIAFKNNNDILFTDLQQKIISNEFSSIYKNNNCIIEAISYIDQYFTLLAIMPVNCTLNDVIMQAINEVNLYGNFLFTEYLITNVKALEKKDIDYYFNKKHKS